MFGTGSQGEKLFQGGIEANLYSGGKADILTDRMWETEEGDKDRSASTVSGNTGVEGVDSGAYGISIIYIELALGSAEDEV